MNRTLILSAALLAFPALAHAGPACDSRANIIAELSEEYGEATTAAGIDSDGRLVELLTSESGETWSIVVTVPGGQSCLRAAGDDWTAVEPKIAGGGI